MIEKHQANGKQSKLIIFIAYITMVIIFLWSGSANIPNYIYLIGILFIAMLILLIRKIVIPIDFNLFTICFISTMMLLNYLLFIKTNLYTRYIGDLLLIVVAYLLTLVINKNLFKKMFLYHMILIAVISLIFYFVIERLSIFESFPVILKDNEEIKYRGFFLYHKLVGLDRNCGAFWEPGIFATFLIGAMIITPMIIKSKFKYFLYLLFLVCIITTKSSAGYVLLLFVLLFKLFNTKICKTHSYIVISLICFIIMALLALLLVINLVDFNFTENAFIQSIYKLKFEFIFDSPRINAVIENFKVFFNNFFTGVGASALDETMDSSIVFSTATSVVNLAKYGIMGLIYTILIIRGFCIGDKGYSNFSKVVLFILVFLIINKEPHDTFITTWCFLFYLNKKESTAKVQCIENTSVIQS